MFKKILVSCLLTFPLAAAGQGDSFLFGHEDELHIAVHNRVLAKVNGKAISVMDVMKKMDLVFLRQYPQYTGNPQARHQFYQVNWKHFLNELIDKELIIADAEEIKMEVSNGDVRQEMEHLFGPNIIENLDSVGLTMEEANKMVQGDILLRRMMYMKVNNKAIMSITPLALRQAYDEYSKMNILPESWTYRLVTIRNPDPALGAETANVVYGQLTEENLKLEDLKNVKYGLSVVSVSDPFVHQEKDLAESFKSTLKEMSPGTFSKPVSQKSRDGSTVYRIVGLQEKKEVGALTFNQIENKLRDNLADQIITKETEAYLKRLRQHFDVQDSHLQELAPEDFQPFVLM